MQFDSVFSFLERFAAAGGGGSGSGDSGGGIEVLFGYIPMHAVGHFLRRRANYTTPVPLYLQSIGWVVCIAYCIFLVNFFGSFGVLISIGAIAGMGAGLYGWFGKLKQSAHTKQKLETAATADRAWDETTLKTHATDIFMRYQQDWANFNFKNIQGYMTQRYYSHASLLLYALQQAGRRNVMDAVQIQQSEIVTAHDDANDSNDTFTMGFTAVANDQLVRTSDQTPLFTNMRSFTEYWQFVRSDTSTWLLDGISQATESKLTLNLGLQTFAEQHGYYYSLDMGWLLIPERGQLFSEAKFGTSDINNHVIGLYKQSMLVQLYTYIPTPSSISKSYLIAQVNVPRNYGTIVVRRKKTLQIGGIKGLEKVEMEWIDFNTKYEVFASAPEQATSFELLSPTYMERLQKASFEVNIEVVDNVVYLYTPEAKTSADSYSEMLDLLETAFQEMRL